MVLAPTSNLVLPGVDETHVSPSRKRSLRRFVPAAMIGPVTAVIGVGALGPLVVLVLYSFGFLGMNESPGIQLYTEILGDSYFRNTFARSLRLAAMTSAVSLVVAVPLAFRISRARGWGRTLLTCLVVLPLLINIVVRNLGWVLVLSPNGVLNSLLAPLGLSQSLLGTVSGMGLVLVHVSIPLVVLPLLSSLDRLDPAQREAALALGAHPALAFFRFTLPAIAPSLLAGAVLSFVIGIGSLVTPIFLGQGRTMVIPTLIVQQISTYRWERAAALSMLLFILVVAVVFTMQRFARRMSSGRSERARRRGALLRLRPVTAAAATLNPLPVAAGIRRWTTVGFMWVMTVFLLLPMFVILKTGVDDSQIPTAEWHGFTTRWLAEAITEDGYRTQLLLSLRLAVVAVVLGLVLSAIGSWAIVRYRFPGRDGLVAFLMSPLLMPQAALAVGFVLFFLILGTAPSFERLLFAHVVVTIPYMTRVLVSTFETIDVRMEEAAAACGARPVTVFRRITLPLLRSGVFTACLFGFLQSFDEAAISVLIASGDTTTLPVKLMSDMAFQPSPVGAAISAILIVLVVAVVVPLERRFGISSSAVLAGRDDS